MKYWFKILIHCKKNKAFNFLLHLFLMKYFSLFSDSVIQKEKSKISSLCPYLLCTSSPVVPVILKKSQTNQKLFRKWKLKECLFHLMIPPPSLFNIFASGVTVGISCYCIGEYLLFYLSLHYPYLTMVHANNFRAGKHRSKHRNNCSALLHSDQRKWFFPPLLS